MNEYEQLISDATHLVSSADKKLSRLTNAAILLAAIVCGAKAVEQSNLLMLVVAFLCTFSYTLFNEE